MKRLARVGLVVVGGGLAAAAVGPGVASAASAHGPTGAKLVRFIRPTPDTLIEKGTGSIRVIVRVRSGARLGKVEIDGVDVTGRLRRETGGYYRTLVRSRDLHYGYNTAIAQATRGGRLSSDHVRFIAARRDDRLLRVTGFSVQTPAAPLQVALRETTAHVGAVLSVAQGVSVRAYVNDRRVDRAVAYAGGRLSLRVGAHEGLRYGRNLIQILVHRTHPYRRQSRYDLESRTVFIRRNAPIASAGADRTITRGSIVRFNGIATKLPPGVPRAAFRWRITEAPKGSRARLRNTSSVRPTLVPDRPGRYEVRVSVRGAHRPPSNRLEARDASDGGTSNDTATVTVMPDIPPAGVRLDTINGNVLLGGRPVSGTEVCDTSGASRCEHSAYVNYAVIDARTLQPIVSGAVDFNPAGVRSLGAIVDGFSGSLGYLVVVNPVDYVSAPIDDATGNALDDVLERIGGRSLSAFERARLTGLFMSAVGLAGAPAGSAFEQAGRLGGALRLNGVTHRYDFVFTDYADFDTDVHQTPTDLSPAALTMRVGDHSYSKPNPGGGVSGFHLLVLNPSDLFPITDSVYPTDLADGSEQSAEVQRLANELTSAADSPLRPLVMLQAFGAPHGNDDVWDQAARQIERLGGTRQVFDAMNAVDPRPLNDESGNRKGPYAFVGRVNETAPQAELSYSLNGLPGRLRGVLMRARDGGYEPMIAGPPRRDGQTPFNPELLHIVDQAPQQFPAFTASNGRPVSAAHARAVQNFLGGPDVTGLCSATVSACDIRKSYYQNYNANWPSIQDDLTNAKARCSQTHQGFSTAECEGIRAQLRDEVSKVAKVAQYFGPLGLQQPFGASGVSALANLGDIAQTIKDAVQPPPADSTASTVLTALSYLSQVGYATPETTPIAAVLGTALSLGGYFTKANGSPDLIGPKINTTAAKLGVELADRYAQAGDHLDDLGRLIVSDYGKLTAVASKVDATPGPGETDWRLGNVGNARAGLIRAAKQTIYERLVPLAYPVMYDLGGVGNARDWECLGAAFFLFDKHLFADQADGAQFVGRFAGGWSPTIAVAQEHATGNGHDARIPGIPASITNTLFDSVDKDGLGLDKLQFYSPHNGFRYLPSAPSRPAFGTFNGLDQSGVRCELLPDPPENSG